MELVWPSLERLPSYKAALERGWASDNLRSEESRREELGRIESDPAGFIASLVDIEARGDPVILPDGSTVKRLPGYHRWMWDGEFSGSIGFRWEPGTEALPPTCLGHIGYSVVPWKQRRGYATLALREILEDVKTRGLRYVDICTVPENLASQKVIAANGGVLVEKFVPPPSVGREEEWRYRISFQEAE
jgi:predicted acetyltransferase